MSVDMKIKAQQLKLLEENQLLFPDEECNVIVPYLPSGYTDYSNNGYVNGQKQIDNYLTYKRVYTGNDCFIVTWKGSTFVNKDLDAQGNIRITWQIGEWIMGYNEGLNSTISIDDDNSFSEYKKQVSSNSITFRIRADKYDLSENYKYYFYKVPEISNDILYRVESLTTEYLGNIKVCYVLNLVAIQQDLENTGRAKQQNINESAPGQGYLSPKVVPRVANDTETPFYKFIDRDRAMQVDVQNFVNRPIKHVVVKAFGLSMLGPFTMTGRKINYKDSMTEFGNQRLIFPINYKQASTPTLYRTQSSEDNYYLAWNLCPQISMVEDVEKAFQNVLEINKFWPNQGILFQNSQSKDMTLKTNPSNEQSYSNNFYGTTSNVGGYIVNQPWRPITGVDKQYDNTGVLGSEPQYTIRGNTPRPLHDYMWDLYWTQKKFSRLPISYKNTLSFGNLVGQGLRAGIGGLGSSPTQVAYGGVLFLIGLVGSLTTSLPNKYIDQNAGFSGLIPCSLYDFMIKESFPSLPDWVANGGSAMKFSYFLNNENSDFIKFFNTETMNTSFEAELTDLFVKNNMTYETILIGQKTKEDGTNVLSNGKELLVNGNESLVPIENENVGFIIDSFNLQAIFSGDFSVEFLDSDKNVVWSGIYQSEAKWTGSIREINSWKNTSIFGRENFFLESPKPWPKEIPYITWENNKSTIDLNPQYTIQGFRTDPNTITLLSELNSGGYWDSTNYNTQYNTGANNSFFDVWKNTSTINPNFGMRAQWKNNNAPITNSEVKYTYSNNREETHVIKIMDSFAHVAPEAFFELYEYLEVEIDNFLKIQLNLNNWQSLDKEILFYSGTKYAASYRRWPSGSISNHVHAVFNISTQPGLFHEVESTAYTYVNYTYKNNLNLSLSFKPNGIYLNIKKKSETLEIQPDTINNTFRFRFAYFCWEDLFKKFYDKNPNDPRIIAVYSKGFATEKTFDFAIGEQGSGMLLAKRKSSTSVEGSEREEICYQSYFPHNTSRIDNKMKITRVFAPFKQNVVMLPRQKAKDK